MRERSSAVVGDLMEQAESRGVAWFWVSVIRVVLSGPAFYGLGLWAICRFTLFLMQYFVIRSEPADNWSAVSWGFLAAGAVCQMWVGYAVGVRSPGREVGSWLRLCVLQTGVLFAFLFGLERILLGPEYIGKSGTLVLAWSLVKYSLEIEFIPTLLGVLCARRGFGLRSSRQLCGGRRP